MKKEEILQKHTEEVFFDRPNGDRALRTVIYYEKAMQEYADQQTSELKAELNEVKKQYSELCDIQKKLCEQNINLESELNNLKESQRMNVIGFANFICLKGYTLIQKNISENGATFFIDKKSIGVNSIELYEQYYKEKFESNEIK